jgi:phage terminase small subunit
MNIETINQPIAAPQHLSERSKALWYSVVPDKVSTPHKLVLVQTALEALDRVEEARTTLLKAGLARISDSTGKIHLNPLCRIEKDARLQFTNIWCKQLHLHWEN